MTFLRDACDLKLLITIYFWSFHFNKTGVGDDRNKVLMCFESVEQHQLTSKALGKYISFCDDILYHL